MLKNLFRNEGHVEKNKQEQFQVAQIDLLYKNLQKLKNTYKEELSNRLHYFASEEERKIQEQIQQKREEYRREQIAIQKQKEEYTSAFLKEVEEYVKQSDQEESERKEADERTYSILQKYQSDADEELKQRMEDVTESRQRQILEEKQKEVQEAEYFEQMSLLDDEAEEHIKHERTIDE